MNAGSPLLPRQTQQQAQHFVVMLEHGGLFVGELIGEITICMQPRARIA